MEYVTQIIETTLNSFDFGYCLIVNILTYIIIKTIDEVNKEQEVKMWEKRTALLVSILFIGVIYYATGQDVKLLVNSAILAPVAWSWIFKPILHKLGLDYKEVDEKLNRDNKPKAKTKVNKK